MVFKTGSEKSKKIIFLNGPPSSGKDTAAKIINQKLHGLTYQYKMALPLKEACHKLLGLQGTLEELEPLKETPIKFLIRDDFNNWPAMKLVNDNNEMTLRQFYIHISENAMKPMFGDDIFGRLAVENLRQSHHIIATISDSGFAKEAEPILDFFGADRICLVRLHRPGTEFKVGNVKDSRSYIDLPVNIILDIENDSDIDKFAERLWQKLSKNFLNGAITK